MRKKQDLFAGGTTTMGHGIMRRLIYLLLLCLLPSAAAWAATTLRFDSLRVGHHDDRVRLVVDLDAPAKYKYFSLGNPDRFVVDLLDVVGNGAKPTPDFSHTTIRNLRSGIRNGTDLRLVFELSRAASGKVSLLNPAQGHGYRLVIELDGAVSQRQAQAPAGPAAEPRVKMSSVAVPSARDIVVAIDAGHGGQDPGAQGPKGTREKDVVLQIARRLATLVEREEGMRPLMIREDDRFIRLADRREMARRHKADIFISIHADAFPDPRAKGASVYALSRNGATSEAARLLANRENASDLIGGVTLNDKDDMLASVLLDLSQDATIEDSIDAANRILQGLNGVARIHKHHVQQAGFAVLKSLDMPSVLVETAFISNPTEERNLRSVRHQQRLAEAMMAGIRSYFIANPIPGTRIAAREHVIRRGDTLSGIASQYRVNLDTLRVANQLKSDALRIGQVLHIPTNDS